MEFVATSFARLEADYQFQTACYALYAYDYLLTLSDEVEKIWTCRLSFPTLLFYINRYLTHIQFIILQVAYYETSWTSSCAPVLSAYSYNLVSPTNRCHHFVRFSGATSLCIIAAIELILILRVYALYLGNRLVLFFLLTILAAAIIVMAFCVFQARPTSHSFFFQGCVMTGSNAFFAFFWAAPLVTDSCIFALTLWRTIAYRKKHVRMTAIDVIFRDGLIYYIIITFAKCLNVFIYLLATEDLNGLGSSFSRVIASIMISRLQLNLRAPSSREIPGEGEPVIETSLTNTLQWKTRTSYADIVTNVNVVDTFFTVANLGETVAGPFSEDELVGPEGIHASDMSLNENGDRNGRDWKFDSGVYIV